MTTSKYFAELRKQNRFKIREGIIVAFQKPRLFNLGKPRIVKTASITDINRRGLAFQYMSHKMWPADFNKLSILQTTDEIEIDRRNEIEHISINRSTGERRRRFSVLKVWSDYFTIDLKMAEKSV